MNLGIFLQDMAHREITEKCFELANDAVGKYDDVSLFFQDIGPKPSKANFGMFNSTEIWHFKGELIVTFLDGLKLVNNIPNDQSVVYYFSLSNYNKDLFGLLENLTDRVTIIASDPVSYDYIKRVTGNKPISVVGDLSKLTSIVRAEI